MIDRGSFVDHFTGTAQTLSKCLATCIPLLLQSAPQSAARLEIFRTQTLVAVAPEDKKEQADRKEIEDIMDEAIGLGGVESLVVGDLPTMNSRAGLYIYLNSLVGQLHLKSCIKTNNYLVGRNAID